MKRRLHGTNDILPGLLGNSWSEIGHDGGSECSAWRCSLHPDEAEEVNAQHGGSLTRWNVGRGAKPRPRTAARAWAHRLFNDGLLAPIFLAGVVLVPLLLWLVGAC